MLDSLFFSIGDGLPQLIRQIVDHRQEREEMNEKISLLPLTQDQQMQVCRRVVRDMGFDFKRGRLDKSAHPFSSGGREDLRITTRLVDDQPLQGLFAAMHECGHALYEMHSTRSKYVAN
jgi:carboxypeptidase Taq